MVAISSVSIKNLNVMYSITMVHFSLLATLGHTNRINSFPCNIIHSKQVNGLLFYYTRNFEQLSLVRGLVKS